MFLSLIILIVLIVILYAFFYIKNNNTINNTFIPCKDCTYQNHLDLSSKCNALCKTKKYNHSSGFSKNKNGSVNCNCQKDEIIFNEKTEINTPTINLPKLNNIIRGDNDYHYVLFDDIDKNIKSSREILKHKIQGQYIENLTNISDDIKKEQYDHYHRIIFG